MLRTPSDEVPWYVAEKAAQGSYATFLGLQLDGELGDGAYRWQALAVGDCCLFHIRADLSFRSFPLQTPDGFGSHPVTVASHMSANEDLLDRVVYAEDALRAGEMLFLMSDAVAQWFMRNQMGDRFFAQRFLWLLQGDRKREPCQGSRRSS
jgi:hypothetical protein